MVGVFSVSLQSGVSLSDDSCAVTATGMSNIPPFNTESRSQSDPNRAVSSRSIAFLKATSKQLKQGKDLLREIEVHTIQRHGFSSVVATGRNISV